MNICLYGASSNDIDKSYITAVERFGRLLAEHGHSLIYGAGAHGLMGAAARGVTSGDGRIIGVVPSFLNVDGILYNKCTEIIYTDTMRNRKQLMEEKSDAFVMTPGGLGTFDEFFEMLTLKQLGRHNKPIAVYNVNGYFDELTALLNRAVTDRFMTEGSIRLCEFFSEPEKLIEYMENYVPEKNELKSLKGIK